MLTNSEGRALTPSDRSHACKSKLIWCKQKHAKIPVRCSGLAFPCLSPSQASFKEVGKVLKSFPPLLPGRHFRTPHIESAVQRANKERQRKFTDMISLMQKKDCFMRLPCQIQQSTRGPAHKHNCCSTCVANRDL